MSGMLVEGCIQKGQSPKGGLTSECTVHITLLTLRSWFQLVFWLGVPFQNASPWFRLLGGIAFTFLHVLVRIVLSTLVVVTATIIIIIVVRGISHPRSHTGVFLGHSGGGTLKEKKLMQKLNKTTVSCQNSLPA